MFFRTSSLPGAEAGMPFLQRLQSAKGISEHVLPEIRFVRPHRPGKDAPHLGGKKQEREAGSDHHLQSLRRNGRVARHTGQGCHKGAHQRCLGLDLGDERLGQHG